MVSIYSPEVRAEAQRYGITDLQAYRKLQAREVILRQEQEKRRAIINQFVADQREAREVRETGGPVSRLIDRVLNRMVGPDWN